MNSESEPRPSIAVEIKRLPCGDAPVYISADLGKVMIEIGRNAAGDQVSETFATEKQARQLAGHILDVCAAIRFARIRGASDHSAG